MTLRTLKQMFVALGEKIKFDWSENGAKTNIKLLAIMFCGSQMLTKYTYSINMCLERLFWKTETLSENDASNVRKKWLDNSLLWQTYHVHSTNHLSRPSYYKVKTVYLINFRTESFRSKMHLSDYFKYSQLFSCMLISHNILTKWSLG